MLVCFCEVRRFLISGLCFDFALTKAYYILDEILIAGELQESSKRIVARLIAAQVWNKFSLFLSVGLNEMKEEKEEEGKRKKGKRLWFGLKEKRMKKRMESGNGAQHNSLTCIYDIKTLNS